jgi:hypothetical protein
MDEMSFIYRDTGFAYTRLTLRQKESSTTENRDGACRVLEDQVRLDINAELC